FDYHYQFKFNSDNHQAIGPDEYATQTFFEVAVDLTCIYGDCLPCFHKFLFETRTSPTGGGDPDASLSAELKDMVLGDFPTGVNINGIKEEAQRDFACNPIANACATVVGPLAGWEIQLLDATGNLVPARPANGSCPRTPFDNPQCTRSDGTYSFPDLDPGTY